MGIDVVDPVREALTDRLKSYFFGGFVLSWVAFHWEAFYVTLFISPEDLQNITKLQYIKGLGYTWLSNWLGPILAGLITPSVILNVDRGLELFKDRCHQKWIRLGDDFAKGDVYPASERRELRAKLRELDAKVEAAEERVAKNKMDLRNMASERDEAVNGLDKARSESEEIQAQLTAAEERVKRLEEAAEIGEQLNETAKRQLSEAQTEHLSEVTKRETLERDVGTLVEQILQERRITHQVLKYMVEPLERVNKVTNGLRDTVQLAAFVNGLIQMHDQAESDRALGGYPAPLVYPPIKQND